MIILYSILCLFIMYFILSGIVMIIESIYTSKEVIKNSKNKTKLSKEYHILLPVLREQNIIESSIEYFYTIAKNEKNIKYYIITTEREDEEYKNNSRETTFEIAKRKIMRMNASDKFELIKAPKESKGKVGQLNYAYNNYIKDKNIDGYIGVYDIDSRPSRDVFNAMENIIMDRKNKNWKTPDIFQQVSSYCNGIENMHGIKGALSIADAFSQTRWALGFEYPLYKIYSKSVLKNKVRPLAYCIGHGCFINIDYMKKIKGFPTINVNDDLSLGYLTSTIGGEICPIPVLDYCEISPKVGISIKQYKFWFSGSSRYYNDIKYYIKKFKIKMKSAQKKLFYIQGGLRNFLWAWRSNIIVLITLISLILNNPLFIGLSILSWLTYVIVPFIVTYIELNNINNEINLKICNLLLGIIFSPINFFIRGIGPCIAMSTNFSGKKNIQYKTER